MKKGKRFLRSLTALVCMLVLLTVDTAPAMAAKVTQADIDALKGSASDLDKKQKEIQSKLNDLKDDKAAALQKKNLLDQQIANYNALILQAEDELADAEQREADQYDLFCKRVREMEEQGTVSYWSVLFKATSFSDLLGRLDIVNEVMDYDQKVIDDLQALQAEIEEKKTGLEASKADLEAAKASLESQKRQRGRTITQTPAATSGRWTAGTSLPPWAGAAPPAALVPRTTRERILAGWATPVRFTPPRRVRSLWHSAPAPTATMWSFPTAPAILRCTPT